MIDEKKKREIVAKLARGESQGEVARAMRISQQMVSKIWRAELGLSSGRRGGDRCSPRYRKRVTQQIQRRGKPW